MQSVQEKYKNLQEYLKSLGSVAVAFSSGVDSTFLLAAAKESLGADHVIAVTASSCSFPKRELEEAKQFCKEQGIRHIVCKSEELDIEGFRQNPKNRCYLCKHELFEKILEIANEYQINAVAELGIKSPLREALLNKKEIRTLSKEMGLPTWDKQSFACLSSRFVYGETISEEKLGMVDKAEQLLLDLGFHQVRVRIHGDIARIEVLPDEIERLVSGENREKIYSYLKQLGFSYVTLDLGGYRMGSMNETLDIAEK